MAHFKETANTRVVTSMFFPFIRPNAHIDQRTMDMIRESLYQIFIGVEKELFFEAVSAVGIDPIAITLYLEKEGVSII